MVDAATLEIINYVKDIEAINNIKILLMFLFAIYAIIVFYMDKKHFSVDSRASFKMMSLGAKVFYIPYLIFFSTIIYQLDPSQDLGFIMQYHLLFYVVFGVYAFIVLAVYLIERLFKDWLGWEITMDGLKINMQRLDGGTKKNA